MNPLQAGAFGYLIAFVAPGSVLLWGLSKFSEDIRRWFGFAAEAETTVGGFLFVALAAIALGVFISGVRWALVDQLLMEHRERTKKRDFKRSSLNDPEVKAAYELANELYYRFYQFYSNMLIAFLGTYVLWLVDLGTYPWHRPAATAAVVGISLSLYFSASDSLGRYYEHLEEILGTKERTST
jgi:hypothetical protein